MERVNIVTECFEYNSAEQEAACFFGERSHVLVSPDAALAFPPGNYRVVDGELFQVIEGRGV